MRQAKQRQRDDLYERAQRMATERSNKTIHYVNQKTDYSTSRAIEANREMLREHAMENSVLGRKGYAVEQDKQPKYTPKSSFTPRNVPLDNDIPHIKRRLQVETSRGQDSLPHGYRRALEKEPNGYKSPMVKTSAYGVTQNPVDEARKRKKLEARIRELANE